MTLIWTTTLSPKRVHPDHIIVSIHHIFIPHSITPHALLWLPLTPNERHLNEHRQQVIVRICVKLKCNNNDKFIRVSSKTAHRISVSLCVLVPWDSLSEWKTRYSIKSPLKGPQGREGKTFQDITSDCIVIQPQFTWVLKQEEVPSTLPLNF